MTATNFNYDYKSFTVVDGSNYDVKAQQTDLFKNVPMAGYVRITASAAITIRLNTTTSPLISQSSSEILEFGQKFIPCKEIDNIYITNTGTATVGILLAG